MKRRQHFFKFLRMSGPKSVKISLPQKNYKFVRRIYFIKIFQELFRIPAQALAKTSSVKSRVNSDFHKFIIYSPIPGYFIFLISLIKISFILSLNRKTLCFPPRPAPD